MAQQFIPQHEQRMVEMVTQSLKIPKTRGEVKGRNRDKIIFEVNGMKYTMSHDAFISIDPDLRVLIIDKIR